MANGAWEEGVLRFNESKEFFFFFFHPFSFPLSMNLFIYFRGPFFGIFLGIRIVEIHEFVECAISAPEHCYQMASNLIN